VAQLHELIKTQKSIKYGVDSGTSFSTPFFSKREDQDVNDVLKSISAPTDETRTILAPLKPEAYGIASLGDKNALATIRQYFMQYEQMAVRRAIELGALGRGDVYVDLKSPELPPYKYDYVSEYLTAVFLFVSDPENFRQTLTFLARRAAWKLAVSQAKKDYTDFCSACLFIIIRNGESAYPSAAAEIRRFRAESKLLNVRIRVLDSTEDVAKEIINIENQHIRDAQQWLAEQTFFDADDFDSNDVEDNDSSADDGNES
jgi:hypothetical protein